MSDSITISTPVNFKKWTVPNHAIVERPARAKQDGIEALPSIPIKELSHEALDALAEAWLNEIYAKAGRASPFMLDTRP